MEALYFFKFWKPNTSQKEHTTMINKGDDFGEEEEEEDSFFELEITTIPPSDNTPTNSLTTTKFVVKKTNSDLISKRKVLPIEPICMPQSPISLLKSAPKLRVLTFIKSRSKVERKETERFRVKVEVEGNGNKPFISRDNNSFGKDPLTSKEKSKLGKYLKLISRFYVIKKVKVFCEEVSSFASFSGLGSPLNVESSTRKDRSKWLGRSKSMFVVAAAGSGSPAVGRRDDSLALHYDGIQSAILHCKNSLSSSKDCSYMSRFETESLYAKARTIS